MRVHEIGHSFGFSVFIDAGEDAGAADKNNSRCRSFKCITVFDPCGCYFRAFSYQVEDFIVKCRSVVSYGKICDYEVNSGFFKVAVSKSVFAKQFCPAHLEPDGVYCVVDNASLVGFAVTRPDFYSMLDNFCLFIQVHLVEILTTNMRFSSHIN